MPIRLIEAGYQVEMSEGYIPINLREYEVMARNKAGNFERVFNGKLAEFIKFAKYKGEI